jgi:putative NADH-flavin reductase
MKLLVLGATGRVGGELVKQGLERGFEITALVRSPQKMQIKDNRLNVVVGNPLDERLLNQVLAGSDAVLSTLGHGNLKESYIVTEAAKSLIKAMDARQVKRLVIVSSTLVSPGGSFLTKIPRYLTRYPINDSAKMEEVVRTANVAWTIVRLVRLTNGLESAYRIFENEPPSVSASISRKTVAVCMLNLVADQSYVQKTIGIVSSRQ